MFFIYIPNSFVQKKYRPHLRCHPDHWKCPQQSSHSSLVFSQQNLPVSFTLQSSPRHIPINGVVGSSMLASNSLLTSKRGEMEMSDGPLGELRRTSLCFIRMCCLNPFSVVATYSHWSHFGFLATTGLSLEVRASCCFFARNSSLLLAFLLRVEGLGIFLAP